MNVSPCTGGGSSSALWRHMKESGSTIVSTQDAQAEYEATGLHAACGGNATLSSTVACSSRVPGDIRLERIVSIAGMPQTTRGRIELELRTHGPVQATMHLYPMHRNFPKLPPRVWEGSGEGMAVLRCSPTVWIARAARFPGSPFVRRTKHAVRVVGYGTWFVDGDNPSATSQVENYVDPTAGLVDHSEHLYSLTSLDVAVPRPHLPVPFWIVATTWGRNYGAGGFILVKRGGRDDCNIGARVTAPQFW